MSPHASRPMSASRVWSRVRGPLLTILVAAVLELLSGTPLYAPNPVPILLPAVLYAIVQGGMLPGLASLAIMLGYHAHMLAVPGEPFVSDEESLLAILIGAPFLVLAVVLIGRLKRRLDRLVISERAAREEAEEARRRADASLESSADRVNALDRQLRESEERYRTIFDHAGDAILISDAAGHYINVNQRACDLTGYSREELLRLDVADLMVGDREENAARYRAAFQEMQSTLHVPAQDRRVRRKDGTVFEYEINAAFLRTGAIMAMIRDVTDRKHLEEQLRQSQKIEAVGRLAGGIAHDFNNLLTAIQGHTEVLLDDIPAGSPMRVDLEEIRKATARAAALTHQLLAFSRRQVLQPRVLELNEVVGEMEVMLRRLIGEDIELVTRLDPALGRVEADRNQLEQVIMNLVVNARDAMPAGGRLTIATHNAALGAEDVQRYPYVQPGPYTVLTISDTGMGMNEKVQARIFEPFFTTKALGKGTGLGLSMVYGIVKQSGGYIWVESEIGRGSTFTIHLPRVEAPPGEAGHHVTARVLPNGTETILLVEDEQAVRSLVRRILERRGYTVLEASGGGEALRISADYAGPIHLLLTDVVMPEMSGQELAGRLSPLRPAMRVLFMSGYTEDAIVHHGVRDNGLNFLGKPFAPDVLARKMREVLDAGGTANGW